MKPLKIKAKKNFIYYKYNIKRGIVFTKEGKYYVNKSVKLNGKNKIFIDEDDINGTDWVYIWNENMYKTKVIDGEIDYDEKDSPIYMIKVEVPKDVYNVLEKGDKIKIILK